MKRVIAILLILILSLQSLCQLGLLAYFNLNREYIAKLFCINKDRPIQIDGEITMCGGTCYLNKNLRLMESPAQQKQQATTVQLKVEIPAFVISEWPHKLSTEYLPDLNHYTPYLQMTHFEVDVSVFHPPC